MDYELIEKFNNLYFIAGMTYENFNKTTYEKRINWDIWFPKNSFLEVHIKEICKILNEKERFFIFNYEDKDAAYRMYVRKSI